MSIGRPVYPTRTHSKNTHANIVNNSQTPFQPRTSSPKISPKNQPIPLPLIFIYTDSSMYEKCHRFGSTEHTHTYIYSIQSNPHIHIRVYDVVNNVCSECAACAVVGTWHQIAFIKPSSVRACAMRVKCVRYIYIYSIAFIINWKTMYSEPSPLSASQSMKPPYTDTRRHTHLLIYIKTLNLLTHNKYIN